MEFLSNKNLMLAYRQARKSRKDKQEVYLWDLNFEENILKLKRDLELWTYIHSSYKNIILFDSKKRYISSPNFRDHIVHHMIHNIIYPVFDKKLIATTYACRKWYGAHKAIKDLQKSIKKEEKKYYNCIGWLDNPEKLYYLKMDISKYFYSINHSILKQIIFKSIKNQHLRLIINKVIDSYQTGNQFDNLFDINSKYRQNNCKWLPIGSIISQLFANIYLSRLDNFIKHKLKIKNYFRYMDDFLILWNKETLNFVKSEIINFSYNELDLTINPKKNNFNLVDDGIKFVWYKIKWWKIYVWNISKTKTNKFLDIFEKIDKNIFSSQDFKRINNSLQSRFWVFTHSSFWLNYFKKRGDIDFPSWG